MAMQSILRLLAMRLLQRPERTAILGSDAKAGGINKGLTNEGFTGRPGILAGQMLLGQHQHACCFHSSCLLSSLMSAIDVRASLSTFAGPSPAVLDVLAVDVPETEPSGPAEVLIGKYLASMGPEKAQELRNQVQVGPRPSSRVHKVQVGPGWVQELRNRVQIHKENVRAIKEMHPWARHTS
eukprot:1142135-Pelagomonas_calceolata.AAC.7